VVYVWKESGVEHGLIASLTDLTIGSAHWSSIDDEYIGQDAISPIDGMSNTNAMIMQGDISGAAYLCDNFLQVVLMIGIYLLFGNLTIVIMLHL
jgi:hypothetical protein